MGSTTKKRFWVSWYGGVNGDPRPAYGAGYGKVDPPPYPWWKTGERDLVPSCVLCAVIDADSEERALGLVFMWWPEMERRFCEERAPGWMPNADRFPPPEPEKEEAR